MNQYTNEDKKNAAVAFVIYGSIKEAHKYVSHIPIKTLYGWVKQSWWPVMVDEAKREHQELIEGRLSDITDKVTAQLIDRIVNGDIVMKYNPSTKEYEMMRVPVRAKELGHIAEKLGNQLRTIRNQPTKISHEHKFDADSLIRDFAAIAEKNRDRIVSTH